MIRKKGNTVYHISSGGFVLYKGKVLLVKNYYHGGIIPPHGHQEKGETLLQTAKREICEETGYCYLRALKKLGPVYYEYQSGGKVHKKTEHRWLFELTKNIIQKKLNSKETKGLQNRWYTLTNALRVASFENTKVHLRVIQDFLTKTKKK